MSQFFPKPYQSFGRDIYIKIDLSNYDLKNSTRLDTSKLAAKFDLVSLKTEVDELDIDKLKSVPTNLINLKSKVDKYNTVKLETTQVELSKLRKNCSKNSCC